ncbi:MAG: DUF3604 domain-containing protein [Candidatus Thorarchaeota archaeon]|nr:DUF3604 domain-containing protein [Candidatus Thorarchaeota archaeon]
MLRDKKPTPKKLALIAVTLIPLVIWSFHNIRPNLMFQNDTVLLWIHAPSTLEPGEEGRILVEAWDRYERVSGTYFGEVEFEVVSYNASSLEEMDSTDVEADLPDTYRFQGLLIGQGFVPPWSLPGGDNGVHEFSFSIETSGIHYIQVSDSQTGHIYWSNPIVVKDGSPHLYWGDVHAHSMLSDGSGLPSEAYYFARNIAGLEFCSITDHGENLHIKNSWNSIEHDTNQAYEEAKFVALQGVEWTSSGGPHTSSRGYGHFTCVVSGNDLPHISADIQKTPEDLWAYLDEFTQTRNIGALAIPHHTVRESFIQDWAQVLQTESAHNKYVRLAEAFSVHGSSLVNPYSTWSEMGSVDVPEKRVNGSSINAALTMGLKMGLMANGDSHDGFPGHSITHTGAYAGHQYPLTMDYARSSHPYPSGITGVFSNELSRENIFSALYSRKTIACSDYGRPYVLFDINGVEPGESDSTVVLVNSSKERTISVFVANDGNPAAALETAALPRNDEPVWTGEIQVFKNGMLWRNSSLSSKLSRFQWTDNQNLTGTSYTSAVSGPDGQYIHEYSKDSIDPDILNTNGADYYFIRILFDSGRTCAVGPIWVELAS